MMGKPIDIKQLKKDIKKMLIDNVILTSPLNQDLERIATWINKHYISRKQLIKEISKLQEEPSRSGIIDIINSIKE